MVDRLEVLCDRRRSRAPGEMLMRQRSRWVGPADLFADGSVGAWYDPSDHTTLFQDSAGTTPANAPGDPVGLALDKSQGLVKGPELVTNGSFDTDTDWTKGTGWTIGSGVASKVVSAASGLDQNIGALSCPIVEVSYDATVTSGALTPQVLGGGAGVHSGPTISASGSYSVYIIAAVGNDTVRFSGDASFAGSVDNVSVRELPGHHAYQDTNDDFRPTLQQDVNGKWYLDFDGVDDFLETSAIDFTATDKMSVFAGVHKASDAGASAFVELSANAGSNDGSFYILAPQSASDTYRYGSKGSTSIVTAAVKGYSAPITNMVTGISDIAGDDTTLRIDGTVATAKAADQGTGNYGNYPLYIGARAGSSLFFNGRLYGLTIVGKTTTDAEIASVERYLANKSGVIL